MATKRKAPAKRKGGAKKGGAKRKAPAKRKGGAKRRR